ncbi:hypothetical protein ACJIZ3_010076 [Penstemon smallii]|uniref:Uncharacterized protein n=1 Tax=Penstemon smallii TaxID=265156 RepID=A0ABD3TEB4_9LAMI
MLKTARKLDRMVQLASAKAIVQLHRKLINYQHLLPLCPFHTIVACSIRQNIGWVYHQKQAYGGNAITQVYEVNGETAQRSKSKVRCSQGIQLEKSEIVNKKH